MPSPLTILRALFISLPLFLLSARAAVVNATWNSPADVAVTASSYSATGNTLNFTLNHAPVVGANLTVVNNTGLPFIQGTFGNLSHGQKVVLTYSGISYNFVSNYFGGTGNDLVLHWANTSLLSWGFNSLGQLGDNSTTLRSLPTSVVTSGVLSGKCVTYVTAGQYHSLALCADGTLASWGNNDYGQLGNNSETKKTLPVDITLSGILAGKTVVAIASGSYQNIALCSDGTLATWGRGGSFALGNNSQSDSSVPIAINSFGILPGKTVAKIAAGGDVCLILCSDGTLAGWGSGSPNSTDVPTAVSSSGILFGKTVTSIAAGNSGSFALCSDGTLVGWGNSGVQTTIHTLGVLAGKTVTAIAAGQYHNLALCSDGTLAAWGSGNSLGQFGNNSVTESNIPVSVVTSGVLSGKIVTSIGATYYNSLALCSDGSIAAWGGNEYGQLGIGSTSVSSLVPILVNSSSLANGEKFITASGGSNSFHSFGIVASPLRPVVTTVGATSLSGNGATLNATVNANSNSSTVSFEYGLTTTYGTTVTASPSPMTGNADTAVSANITGLMAGTTYHYRVKAINSLGTTLGANMTFIAASNNANLSSLTPGTGSLAPSFSASITEYAFNVSNTTSSMTIRPTLADTTASVRVNGIVVNSNTYSGAINLVVGSNVISTMVTAQDGITTKTYNVTVTRLSANADLASLTTSAGAISPAFDAATVGYTLTVLYEVTGLKVTPTVADATATVKVNTVSVISGTQSGTLSLAVGNNTFTVLVTAQNAATKTYTVTVTRQALVTTYNSVTDVPVTVNGLTATGNTANLSLNFAPLSGTNLTLVNNTGMNFITGAFTNLAHGQIVALSFGGVTYNFVANYYGGNGNDLVLQWANTRPLAWGSNGSGQLGNNGVLDSAIPVPVVRTGVLAGKTLLALSSGGNHSLALATDGTMSSWGNNSYGQLGNNTSTDSLAPVGVNTTGVLSGKTVIAIAAGQYHNLALCSDGTLAAWGYNFCGQLGNNSTTQSSLPVAVNKTGVLSGKTIISIAAGTYHSFALCSDGTLAAWGYNGNGELGKGGTGYSQLPVLVDNSGVLAGKTIGSVIAGSFHNFALCTDGTLAGWGYNAYGQLGTNSTSSSTVPVLVVASGVLAGKTVVSASAGYYHTLALCSDGTLAAWGSNGYGELGNGNNTSSAVPVAVTMSGVLVGKSVTGVSAGAVYNVALCSDGTLAAWGYNGDGELGNNSAVSSNVPVLVNSASLAPGERFVAGRSGSTSLHTLALVASPPLPVVTTLAASGITSSSAVLNGAINPNGTATTPTFEYGLTTAYGTSVAGSPSSVTGTTPTAVSATITGLAPGTTYHYRLSGTSAGGTTTSADGIFTTAGYNANLSGLTLSAGTLDPVFSTNTIGYAANVPSTTTTISVTPTVATPSSTVKVNGASVVSGSTSTPIFLLPGNNTITVVVTAQDLVTTKTYTISVTRLSPAPEIGITQSVIAISDGGSKDFGPATGSRPSLLSFVIKNTGNSNLTGLGITIDGPDGAQFSLFSPPTAPVSGPTGSTTFIVAFTPVGVGIKSAALHIASNDADENPYDIAISGTGLSSTVDTDGDGLNDAAEFQMEALGFEWQVSQPALVNVYYSNAETGGLGSGQGLYLDAPKLTKNPATGLFTLRIGIQKSTNLLNFTPFPMTAPQTTISGDGKMEFEFASPDNAVFYRLLAE